MKELRQIIVMLAGLCLSVIVSILVFTKGWGLEPKSWFWIIGFSFIGQIFAHIIIEIGKSKD